ncbi:hypothetical protein SSX86_001755 [Deinandra increscens subsp. villosa]|uniref:Uncharacterized protein n=1 Tax=Deinandra increscens subsp. villosa TaxID=3103831 RepID=A0AAP0DS01_9ASTR
MKQGGEGATPVFRQPTTAALQWRPLDVFPHFPSPLCSCRAPRVKHKRQQPRFPFSAFLCIVFVEGFNLRHFIRRCQSEALQKEAEVAKIVDTQSNLERQPELIETHQQEVNKRSPFANDCHQWEDSTVKKCPTHLFCN